MDADSKRDHGRHNRRRSPPPVCGSRFLQCHFAVIREPAHQGKRLLEH